MTFLQAFNPRKLAKVLYLTTNILPMHPGLNNGSWSGLEDYLRNRVQKEGHEFYLIAGGYGSKDAKPSIDVTDSRGKIQSINVPEYLWKVVVDLPKPGAPITADRDAYAIWMPNDNIAGTGKWQDYRISINQLEENLKYGPLKYDFLSYLPDSVKEDLKEKNSKASLLADGETILSSGSFVPNTTIWHDGIDESNSLQLGTFQINPSQVSIFDVGTLHQGVAQVSSSQVNTHQIGSVQIGTTQINTSQIPTQTTSTQIGTTQIYTTQVGITKLGESQISATQISTAQVSSIQGNLFHVGITEISPTQVSISHGPIKPSSTQIGTTQIDTIHLASITEVSITQINPTQIGSIQNAASPYSPIVVLPSIRNTQLNPGEISFPSSISAQQLFNLYDFSFHTSSSTSTNTINSTAKTLWSTLFDPTNPFDLTLQINDLPTGQLAEAQITRLLA